MISMILGFVFLCVSFCAFFLLGLRLLSIHLLDQYYKRLSHSIQPLLSRSFSLVEVTFALTLAFSLQLFLLLLLDIAGRINDNVRWLFWRLSLTLLFMILGIIIPLLFIKTIVLGRGLINGRKLVILLLMFAIYLAAFRKLGQLFPVLSAGFSFWTLDFWGGRIGIVGVALMAMLSGFAAADKPIQVFFRLNPGLANTFSRESRVKDLLDEISKKRERLERLNRESQSGALGNGACQSNAFRRLYTLVLSTMNGNESERLMMDIAALEALHAEASLELSYVQSDACSNSMRHLFMYYLDKIWAIYCIYKILSVFFNVFIYRISSADPVSLVAGIFLHFLNVRLDVQYCSMQFTLWSIGVLVWCSLKTFLSRLMSYLTLFSPFDSAEASVLTMSYVAGVYFVSSVLTLKNSLPAAYGGIISEFLPKLKFDYFSHWFDVIFLLSVGLSSAILVLKRHNK